MCPFFLRIENASLQQNAELPGGLIRSVFDYTCGASLAPKEMVRSLLNILDRLEREFADRYDRRSMQLTGNLAFSDRGQNSQGEHSTAALLLLLPFVSAAHSSEGPASDSSTDG